MKILLVGDLHGIWGPLNHLINKKKPDGVISLGDFGYWPKFDNTRGEIISYVGRRQQPLWRQNGIKLHGGWLRWLDGNHEDHNALDNLKKDNPIINNGIRIHDEVFWQPRCSTFTLPDGRVILFMGGAQSIDKFTRTEHVDWFHQETISYSDFQNLPDRRVDIVCSHTCPYSFLKDVGIVNPGKVSDPSCEALEQILDIYHPEVWYFGHWHHHMSGYTKGCYWHLLNMQGQSNWWRWLK